MSANADLFTQRLLVGGQFINPCLEMESIEEIMSENGAIVLDIGRIFLINSTLRSLRITEIVQYIL